MIDDFRGCYGVHPKVLAELWLELQIDDELAKNPESYRHTFITTTTGRDSLATASGMAQ